MFVTLVDEKAGTETSAILIEKTHDGARATILSLNPLGPEIMTRIPYGADNAYIDDDGKHGNYVKEGDPDSFSEEVSTSTEKEEDDISY